MRPKKNAFSYPFAIDVLSTTNKVSWRIYSKSRCMFKMENYELQPLKKNSLRYLAHLRGPSLARALPQTPPNLSAAQSQKAKYPRTSELTGTKSPPRRIAHGRPSKRLAATTIFPSATSPTTGQKRTKSYSLFKPYYGYTKALNGSRDLA